MKNPSSIPLCNISSIRSLLLVAMLLCSVPAIAQEEVGLAAIVNDSAISNIDLQERVKIAMFASNLPANQGFEEKLVPQVLRSLIDERIYMKEAQTLNVTVGTDEIARVVADIEKRNKIQPGKFDAFLKSNGLSSSAMQDQIKSQIIWSKIVSRAVRPKIAVTDKEIDEAIEHISKQSGIEEINVSEILLTVDSPSDNKKVRSLAEKLSTQLLKDGDFAKIAKQFSKAASAENGGDMGWVNVGQLDDKVLAAAKNMRSGEISKPIRTEEGYIIIRINDRRALVATQQESGLIGLKRAVVRIAKETDARTSNKIGASISKQAKEVKSCNDFAAFAKNIGSVIDPQTIKTLIENLAPDIRDHLHGLKTGEVSDVFTVDGGLSVIMVCERAKSAPAIALKNKIKEGLMMKKLEIQANRYLRDLRRGAFIEVRI